MSTKPRLRELSFEGLASMHFAKSNSRMLVFLLHKFYREVLQLLRTSSSCLTSALILFSYFVFLRVKCGIFYFQIIFKMVFGRVVLPNRSHGLQINLGFENEETHLDHWMAVCQQFWSPGNFFIVVV